MKVKQKGGWWQGEFTYTDAHGAKQRWRRALKLRASGPGAVTKREALRQLETIRAGLHTLTTLEEHGIHLPAATGQTECALSGLTALWLKHKRGRVKPSTAYRYSQSIALYIKPKRDGWPGDCDARTLTVLHVRSLQAALVAEGLGVHTVNCTLTALRSILQTGVDGGYLTENVARGCKPLKKPQPEWDWFTVEESAKLIEASRTAGRGRRYTEWWALFAVALRSGLRPGEMMALKWDCIDLVSGHITVKRTLSQEEGGARITEGTKGRKTRRVPIDAETVEVLRGLQHLKGDLVFCAEDGTRLRNGEFYYALKRSCRAAGLRAITPHDLRHSYASQLARAGVPLRRIQELLGHGSIQMTERYAHVLESDLKTDVERLPSLGLASSRQEKGKLSDQGKGRASAEADVIDLAAKGQAVCK